MIHPFPRSRPYSSTKGDFDLRGFRIGGWIGVGGGGYSPLPPSAHPTPRRVVPLSGFGMRCDKAPVVADLTALLEPQSRHKDVRVAQRPVARGPHGPLGHRMTPLRGMWPSGSLPRHRELTRPESSAAQRVCTRRSMYVLIDLHSQNRCDVRKDGAEPTESIRAQFVIADIHFSLLVLPRA
jgi:hypothetical protein